MYLDKLPGLKAKLLEATDFGEIFEYFFTELGNDAAFACSGEPTQDRLLLQSAATATARTVGEAGAFVGTLQRIASHRFVHGAFSFGDTWQVLVLYFEDLNLGFLAIGDASGPSRFTRFSVILSPDGKPPKVH
jgi:hypothetical protein